MTVFLSSLGTAIDVGTVILLAGLGELILERTGVLNLGIEGMISIGAAAAVLVAASDVDPWVSLAIATACGAVMGGVFALFAVVVRINQILAGLAMFLIGIGLANELGSGYANAPVESTFSTVSIPVLSEIPDVGPALFDHAALVYLAYLVFPLGAAFVLFRTRHGTNLRAVGEDPAAADAAGISVMRIRCGYCLVAGGFAAMAGAYLMLHLTPSFSLDPGGGRGWVAIAAVIFAAWIPWRLIVAALLFGGLTSLGLTGQAQGWEVPSVVFSVLPFVFTILLMAGFVLRLRLKRVELRNVAPAALATDYYREAR